MKVNLMFVPPGGGEIDYTLEFDLPGVPQTGDYITVRRDGADGSEDFIVRRTWWQLSYPEGGITAKPNEFGSVRAVNVECEFAIGPYSSESHRRGAGSKAKEFEATGY